MPPFPAPFVPEIGAGAEPDVPGRAERGEGGRARCTVAQWPGSLVPKWGRAGRRSGRTMAQRLLAGLALLLLLLGAVRVASGGFSLHPPYFNLAEGARIHASATCGEEITARGVPRPTEDLYCKLVGGPVAGGDPNQTIQVSNRRVPRGPRDPYPTLRIWGW